MTIHFTEQEFGQRQDAVCRSLVDGGLDGLLIFPSGEHVLPDRL